MKYKYKIGDWVKVKNKVSFNYDKDNNRIINKEEVNIFGQICGAKRRQLGKLSNSPSSYGQSYLKVGRIITVWLVRTGMINKPIEALEEDIDKMLLYVTNEELPWFNPFANERIKKRCVEEMKEEAKYIERDSKGRFTGKYKNPFKNEHGN